MSSLCFTFNVAKLNGETQSGCFIDIHVTVLHNRATTENPLQLIRKMNRFLDADSIHRFLLLKVIYIKKAESQILQRKPGKEFKPDFAKYWHARSFVKHGNNCGKGLLNT